MGGDLWEPTGGSERAAGADRQGWSLPAAAKPEESGGKLAAGAAGRERAGAKQLEQRIRREVCRRVRSVRREVRVGCAAMRAEKNGGQDGIREEGMVTCCCDVTAILPLPKFLYLRIVERWINASSTPLARARHAIP